MYIRARASSVRKNRGSPLSTTAKSREKSISQRRGHSRSMSARGRVDKAEALILSMPIGRFLARWRIRRNM